MRHHCVENSAIALPYCVEMPVCQNATAAAVASVESDSDMPTADDVAVNRGASVWNDLSLRLMSTVTQKLTPMPTHTLATLCYSAAVDRGVNHVYHLQICWPMCVDVRNIPEDLPMPSFLPI